jgi:hypothetical protein
MDTGSPMASSCERVENLSIQNIRYPDIQPGEYLTGVALVRDGKTHTSVLTSHWQLRAALGDDDPYTAKMGDRLGFATSTGRFVDRREGNIIAFQAGQIPSILNGRPMLSSDINWKAER